MAVNLYDAAIELQKLIRQSDEYVRLKYAYDRVNTDETAKRIFDNFRHVQMNLQQKQLMGQEITQSEVEQAQKTVALAQQNEKIAQLMQAEQRMGMMIGELNQIIMKPLEELYGKA